MLVHISNLIPNKQYYFMDMWFYGVILNYVVVIFWLFYFSSHIKFHDGVGGSVGLCAGFRCPAQFAIIQHAEGSYVVLWYYSEGQNSQPIYEGHWFTRRSAHTILPDVLISIQRGCFHHDSNHVRYAYLHGGGASIDGFICVPTGELIG